jgi:hypothetical protein
MTVPPIAPDVDLGQLPWFPILRRRLFRSQFHLMATDAEWRAGMTLWIRSWDQQPSGSLPNDDGQLQRLAGLARANAKWRRVRDMALHGWYVADDGRLYHDTVAEVVNDGVKWKTKSIRTRRERRLKSKADSDNLTNKGIPPLKPPKNELGAINPKMMGHSPPCHCDNCQRWAREQLRATG